MALDGSCACGKIRYQINGTLIGPVTYCHCWRCRKHSGASFGTTAGVRREDLAFIDGASLLSSWESSTGTYRYFASCCGSPIYKEEVSDKETLGFRLGTLDSDPGVKVAQHYMVDAMAPWVEISDSLEQVIGGDGPFPERLGQQP